MSKVRLEAIAKAARRDLLNMASELDGMEARVMDHWQRLDPFEFSQDEILGEQPMSLPHAVYGELRDVASQLGETALYLRSTGTLTAVSIREAWKTHRVHQARAEAYASVARLLVALNDPKANPGLSLRATAEKILVLAERFRGAGAKPHVRTGWKDYYEEVNRYLNERDLTQAALAHQFGVSPSQLSSTIRGIWKVRSPKQTSLLREIVKLTGIKPPGGLPAEKEDEKPE